MDYNSIINSNNVGTGGIFCNMVSSLQKNDPSHGGGKKTSWQPSPCVHYRH